MGMKVYVFRYTGSYGNGVYLCAAKSREEAQLRANATCISNLTPIGSIDDLKKLVLEKGEVDYTYYE